LTGILLPLTLRLLLEDEVAGELRKSQFEVLTEEATVRSGLVSTRSESRPIWSSVKAGDKIRYLLREKRSSLALAADACLEEVGKEVRVSKGIVRGFTRNKYLHSSWVCTSEQWGSSGNHHTYHM